MRKCWVTGVSGEEQDDVTLQVSADIKGELMLHVIATGPGQLFVDGRLMTSWRRPCTLHQVRASLLTKVIAVFIDITGDSTALGLSVVNTTVSPTNQWLCTQREVVADWAKRPVITFTDQPIANVLLRNVTCPQPKVPYGDNSNNKTCQQTTQVQRSSQKNSVQLHCRSTLTRPVQTVLTR